MPSGIQKKLGKKIMARGYLQSCLVAVAFLASLALASKEQHGNNNSHGQGSHHHGEESHGGHEGGHGVALASWRWLQFKQYNVLCITMILGTVTLQQLTVP